MPLQKLMDMLERENISYSRIHHPVAYTTQEVAANAHVSGYEMAKTVLVHLDGKPVMAVLPANYHVDLDRLKDAAGARQVDLAHEDEITAVFSDCETGAMPPFGNLYNMEEFVDRHLTEDEEIAFNAGDFNEVIKISYHDFEHLTHPKVADFALGPE